MNSAQKEPDPRQVAYFRDQLERGNAEYWQRVGDIDFKDKTVLDIGCGHGAMSVHAALCGAKRVVGVDIDRIRIEFARGNVQTNYPELSSVIQFECCPLEKIEERFDIALSKDSFEHIENLPGMMLDIAARLNEDGLLVTGFSPLYYSPFGDHGRYLVARKIPWFTVMLPEPLLFALATRLHKKPIRSAADVGLNKLTPQQFRRILTDQGWKPVMLEYNKGGRLGMPLMRLLRKVPFLERHFTVSIYAKLLAPQSGQLARDRQLGRPR